MVKIWEQKELKKKKLQTLKDPNREATMSPRYSAQDKLIKLARMIIETTEFLVVSQYTEKELTKKCLEKTFKSALKSLETMINKQGFPCFFLRTQ